MTMARFEPRLTTFLLAAALVAALAAAPSAAVELTIFGDFTFVDSDAPDSPSSFALGDVDFFVTQQINDRLTATLELDFHAHHDGEVEADVERLWIRYEVSEVFQIAAGRFHTPLGYWNRTYHHGALIQDTVDRPFVLDWEHDGGVLPMHIVGLMATGEAWAGVGTFRYEVVVGNGQELSSEAGFDPAPEDRPVLDPNNLADGNNDKSAGARLSLKSDRGWQVGLFGLRQEIAETGSPDRGSLAATGDSLVDQTVLGLDLRYEAERFGFLGEVFDIDNQTIGDVAGRDATAFYVQSWVDFSEKCRLTYRFSSLDVDPLDPFFRLLAVPAQDHNVLTLGYRMDEVAVIKLEVDQRTGIAGLDDVTTLRAQWAFMIP